MKIKFCFKYTLWLAAFVAIHYLEGLPPIAGLSIAQLWKIPLLIFLLSELLRGKKTTFERIGILLFLEVFLCPEIFQNPLTVILYGTKNLLLILFFHYWKDRNITKLETIMYSLAQFICLSSIPLLLGLVEPPFEEKTTDSFGIEMGYFRGIFGTPHTAASYFSAAIIILITGITQRKFLGWRKYFNLILIVVGLISIFNAYVRTGWLMLLISMLFLFDFSSLTTKRMIVYVLSLFLIGGTLAYLYNYNEAFYGRVTGRNVYRDSGGNGIDTEGSGRNIFWKNAINVWSNSSVYEHLFGVGYTKVTEENQRTTGMRVFSHSQFFDSLAQYGLVGLFLLISYYVAIYRYIKRNKSSPYYRLSLALLFGGISFCLFQNELYFVYAILFSLSLALCRLRTVYPLNLNT